MKLNKLATFAVAVAVMAFGFVACNNNNEVEAQRTYSDEEILDAVTFVGQGGADNFSMLRTSPPGYVTLVTMRLGRKSRGCTGFGICEVWIGSWQVWNIVPLDDPNYIFLTYYEGKDLSNLHLRLAEQPGIDMRHVLLAVEEDVVVRRITDSSVIEVGTIPAQDAHFRPGLSDYGGFEIRVVPSEPVVVRP